MSFTRRCPKTQGPAFGKADDAATCKLFGVEEVRSGGGGEPYEKDQIVGDAVEGNVIFQTKSGAGGQSDLGERRKDLA